MREAMPKTPLRKSSTATSTSSIPPRSGRSVRRNWPKKSPNPPSWTLPANGLLLRPRRKARVDWAKAFRRPPRLSDGLAAFRELTNELDRTEWAW